MKLSIIIKALNEENNISACIESCIEETHGIDAEIILVDSLSKDKTVSIAKQYPIKIVQFEDFSHVNCGAAAQLGYQYSTGDYVYIIDGDMRMCPDFISSGISFLENNATYAGVGGKLIDTQIFSSEDARRLEIYSNIDDSKEVTHLGGGGIYRREAIESVGYFGHQGLCAFEEAELGVRLVNKGWKLIRLSQNSVFHTGHNETTLKRLIRLWKNGRMQAHGMFIKSSLSKPWWNLVLKQLWFVFAPILLNLFFIALILVLSLNINIDLYFVCISYFLMWGGILLALTIKRKNLKGSAVSILTWHIACLAAMSVVFKQPQNPNSKIVSSRVK